jgi:probable nitrogen fixation protein
MSADVAAAPPAAEPVLSEGDAAALQGPFLRTLVRQVRAHDVTGFWEGKSDAALLAPYVLSREQRRQIPTIADPDSRTVWRVEQFYAAVGLCIEQQTKIIASPLVKLTHEGFGRVVLIAGRLVVVNRFVRDIHRFGFDSLEALAADGEKLTADAVAMIERFPEVADL